MPPALERYPSDTLAVPLMSTEYRESNAIWSARPICEAACAPSGRARAILEPCLVPHRAELALGAEVPTQYSPGGQALDSEHPPACCASDSNGCAAGYDVPVHMGWSRAPLSEAELNPLPLLMQYDQRG